MQFLRTLLIILIVLVGLRLLWKAFGKQILRWLGKKAMQKVQRSFEKRTGFSGFPPNDHTPPNPRQSKTKTSSQPIGKNKKVGEYIDFEEID